MRKAEADGAAEDLFAQADVPEGTLTRPLAVRMRPTTLDEVVGQEAALAPGSPLRRLAQPQGTDTLAAPNSVILFGPPGVGKTTLATIVARASGRAFEQLSAVTSGVRDVRSVLTRARERLVSTGRETILFIDEVHRFSKSQQDALLPAVENRDVTFVAATTENPSFSVISPLLSRSVVVKLEPLDDSSLRRILDRAISSPQGLAGKITVEPGAVDQILRFAGGDARKALTILESAAGAVDQTTEERDGRRKPAVSAGTVDSVMQSAQVRYDRTGDEHYDVASAFIKSMRGSDVDASLHYLARMLRGGEDPRFIARRIMIAASEEVGMAAPQVLELTVSAAQAVALVGMPEAQLILAQAVIAVATAPKSNACYLALAAALKDVDSGNIGTVPLAIRNAPTRLMKQWGNHAGYRYAHDWPDDIAPQQYMPEPLRGHEYYHPKDRGYEAQIARRLPQIRRILRGEDPSHDRPLAHSDMPGDAASDTGPRTDAGAPRSLGKDGAPKTDPKHGRGESRKGDSLR